MLFDYVNKIIQPNINNFKKLLFKNNNLINKNI